MMIHSIAKLLKILNSETDPHQISLSFSFSMIVGLTPLLSLHNILVLFLVLFLRVNLSAFLLGFFFFSGLAYLLDPLFHQIGLVILTSDPLEGFWTALYNSTLWKIERFYNSIVMGSLLFSAALFIPLFLLSNTLIARYREQVLTWVQRSRIMQVFRATRLYQAYRTVSGWGL